MVYSKGDDYIQLPFFNHEALWRKAGTFNEYNLSDLSEHKTFKLYANTLHNIYIEKLY